ncbi:metallophosphoesterase family protein [Paenibacillus sp. S3N08]|uniref:Metallophosphoesterase family protein n=2 Tax=Paenibacillus agricola TaxID=2716264 RepID=A0ABX0JA44_9BACL|nr:metallophosphoesterase family protein [Paenibacillus agricola]
MVVVVVTAVIVQRGDSSTPTPATNSASSATSIQPKSVVTTFNGDARTTRGFTWYTESTDTATHLQLVKGGATTFTDPNIIEFTGTTTTLQTGKKQVQSIHKVLVTNLAPGTEYAYRVGDQTKQSWSEPVIFNTEAQRAEAFTFLNVSDSQGISESDFELWGHTLDGAFAKFPKAEFIVHNGDLVEEPEDETAWDYFFGKTRSWLKQIPLMPVTGNHDEVDGVADRYLSHFYLPDNGPKGSIPGTAYSFDYGNAHIAVLNTESNFEAQTKWLREDLARTNQPWKLIAMHRGAYGGNAYKKVEKWIAVFDEFKVDLVLQGHNHEYSRSYPLRNGIKVGDGEQAALNREGTVYVVTNTAGAKFNEKKDDLFYHKVHLQNGKQMFAGITIEGDKLTYQAYDIEGNLVDSFVIQH